MVKQPTPDRTLDCLGFYCPIPVTRTAELVRQMKCGEVLEVVGDDPGMQIDIPAWCLSNGHPIVSVTIVDGIIRCVLEVGQR